MNQRGSEIPAPEVPRNQEREANTEAYALILALRGGASLDETTLEHLRMTLAQYETRHAAPKQAPANRVAQPKQESVTEARTAAEPASPAEPIRTETRAEPWLEQEPWKRIQSEVVLGELRKLTEQERKWVEKMSDILARDTKAFRIVSGKAIGAEVRPHSHDYHCVDVKTSPDPEFTWRKWMDYMQKQLPDEFGILARSYKFYGDHKNIVSVMADPFLADRQMAIVGVHLDTPGYLSYVDDRAISHQALLFVKEGAFTEAIKRGEHVKLLPFVYQCAGLKMDEKWAAYFDNCLSGNKPYGTDKNPIVAVYDTPAEKVVHSVDDTSLPGDIVNHDVAKDSQQLVGIVGKRIGTSVPYQKEPMRIGSPTKGDDRGHPFTRVQRGDDYFLRPVSQRGERKK